MTCRYLHFLLIPVLVLIWSAGTPKGAVAQATEPTASEMQAEVGSLLEALGLDDLAKILREEGLSYAESLEQDMFAGRSGGTWDDMVSRVYATDRMEQVMAREMAERLPAEHISELVAFFRSELGGRIILLEITAREAMLEDSVDEASRLAFSEMREAGDARIPQLDSFVAANDLVEMNVAGALNSNLAFYRGLSAGGAFNGVMTEDEMLSDVWEQEEEIRTETTEWIYAYLSLAYRPLEDDELDAYIALSKSEAGQALNAALFASFDVLFSDISYDLGRAAATFMAGEDI